MAFKTIISSSKRPVLIGMTVTKQLGSKAELDEYVRVTNCLKDAGIYKVFTYNPIDLTVTYDYMEGVENQDITTHQNAVRMIESYATKKISGLGTVDQLHKSLAGFTWPKWCYDLLKTPMNYLCHDDINKVNIIKGPDGYTPIDWERASMAPAMYDLGSWIINQVIYNYPSPNDYNKLVKAFESKLKGCKYADEARRYALIDAMFVLALKHKTAKLRKVYGINGLEMVIKYLKEYFKIDG